MLAHRCVQQCHHCVNAADGCQLLVSLCAVQRQSQACSTSRGLATWRQKQVTESQRQENACSACCACAGTSLEEGQCEGHEAVGPKLMLCVFLTFPCESQQSAVATRTCTTNTTPFLLLCSCVISPCTAAGPAATAHLLQVRLPD